MTGFWLQFLLTQLIISEWFRMIDLSIVPDSYAQMLIDKKITYDEFVKMANEFCDKASKAKKQE